MATDTDCQRPSSWDRQRRDPFRRWIPGAGNRREHNGYGYGGGAIRFSCRTDPRGYVVDVDFNNRQYGNENYGNGNYGNGYYGSNYDNPYSVYGYQRY